MTTTKTITVSFSDEAGPETFQAANTGLSDAVLWHEVRSWLRATAAAVRGEG